MGHQRVLEVTALLLKDRHKKQVKHLMEGDLLEYAGWEEKMMKAHPESHNLHWHHQSPEWNCSSVMDTKAHLRCDRQGDGGSSLFCALAYFFDQLAHHALLNNFPKPKEPINAPDELDVLKKVAAHIKTSHHARWLVTLLADLHQPLHLLPAHHFGAGLRVKYNRKETDLLEFFEDFLPSQLPPLPSAEKLQAHFKSEMRHWHATPRKRPVELFRYWGKDVARSTCKEILSAMEPLDPKVPFEVNSATYQRWLNITQELTIRAGERVAFSLLDVLEHKKHKLAHKEGRGAWHKTAIRRPDGFTYNFMIGCIVVPTNLLLLRWHESGMRPSFFNFFGRAHAKV